MIKLQNVGTKPQYQNYVRKYVWDTIPGKWKLTSDCCIVMYPDPFNPLRGKGSGKYGTTFLYLHRNFGGTI